MYFGPLNSKITKKNFFMDWFSRYEFLDFFSEIASHFRPYLDLETYDWVAQAIIVKVIESRTIASHIVFQSVQ